MWFTAIMAFFKAAPMIVGGLQSFMSAYYNAKVQITTARIGGDVTVAKAMIDASIASSHDGVERLKVIAGSKVLLFLIVGFALPWMIYEWKVVAYDNIISPALFGITGLTLPIKGDVAGWAKIILTCIFGSGTAITAGSMYFNRSDK